MKRKDIQRLAHQLTEGINQMRTDLANAEAKISNQAAEIERLREWKLVADLFGVAFRVDEWGQYPPSNGDDVHEAVLAYERLKTKEARRG